MTRRIESARALHPGISPFPPTSAPLQPNSRAPAGVERGAQKAPPGGSNPQEAAGVVPGSAQHRAKAVSNFALNVAAFHVVIGFEVTDGGLNGMSAFEVLLFFSLPAKRWAGLPNTVTWAGTLRSTTLPSPTRAQAPIFLAG